MNKPPEFDPVRYAAAYRDVEMTGLSPLEHYQKYGKLLGRSPCPEYNRTQDSDAPDVLDLKYTFGADISDQPSIHRELISVIIPNHNNAKYLPRAMNAILSQVGVNVELIVVDDGSTDDSLRIAEAIRRRYDNVKVISLIRNFGCYYARNFGVTKASGEFICVVDSDDMVSEVFLKTQLEALKADPKLVACRSQQRRWSADYRNPLTALRPGENSLLWRKSIIDVIGWYDSVKYSGDVEFRLRIQRNFGTASVAVLDEELYYTRTLENSLTTSSRNGVFRLEKGKLQVQLSEPRKRYESNFTIWQKANKPAALGTRGPAYIEFPQLNRPFELGVREQNASPSLGSRRVGAMASFPLRRESLRASVASIISQVDELIIYLNDYPDTPDFLINDKIRVVHSAQAVGDLRDNGKFFDLPEDDESYIFTFDDDIIYPEDYTATLIHNIEMLGRQCVVGVHGVIFPERLSDLRQRTVFHFMNKHGGRFVDLLGTGTTAWHSSTLKLTLDIFKTKGVCDLWFANEAHRNRIPLYSIERERKWLNEHMKYEESLWKEAASDSSHYFDVFNNNLAYNLNLGVRACYEKHLKRGFSVETLSLAGIELEPRTHSESVSSFEIIRHFEVFQGSNKDISKSDDLEVHFHIVINGWNCRSYVDDCLRSIAAQEMGSFSYEVTLVDDGSTDGTFQKLAGSTILPGARLIRIDSNSGPAYARHIGITSIEGDETVVVLIDMDDSIEKNALKTVADRYKSNSACLLTIGNWIDQNGKINPQDFYSDEEIDLQKIRSVDLFNATHLRTFKRKLYNAIDEQDLLDPYGNWLETCTDVALMYPLIDQCWSDEIEFISDPIYRYTRQHGNGTLARFGKPHKVERLEWLKAKSPKQRLNVERNILRSKPAIRI